MLAQFAISSNIISSGIDDTCQSQFAMKFSMDADSYFLGESETEGLGGISAMNDISELGLDDVGNLDGASALTNLNSALNVTATAATGLDQMIFNATMLNATASTGLHKNPTHCDEITVRSLHSLWHLAAHTSVG